MTATILRAGTLLVTSDSGDIEGAPAAGLYVRDTRLLSQWALRVNGYDLQRAGSAQSSSDRTTALLLPGDRREPSMVFVLRRQAVTSLGLVEHIVVQNVAAAPFEAVVTLNFEVDFADQFAVRSDRRVFDFSAAQRTAEATTAGASFTYRHRHAGRTFAASAHVSADPLPLVRLGDDRPSTMTWRLRLEPNQSHSLTIRVGPADQVLDAPARPLAETAAQADWQLQSLLEVSLDDLEALVMPSPIDPSRRVPAAGAPWFLTLFGRDSLLTAELVAHRRPDLVEDVLRALAATQGTRDDPASQEQPGRIVHEVRISELATLGMVPYARYYGSVDVTPLFVAILGRQADRTGGPALAAHLEAAARAAVEWIRGPGGLDADGFVSFVPDPAGLLNQGWKDSEDATCFADGSLATGPIALCEVQGYTWEALTAAARLARTVWDDASYADELDALADALRTRFLDTFWMPDRDYPALALDGEGHAVDGLGSNAGHLLWSGVLPQRYAAAVARRLLSPEFFTGWGLRTLAAGQSCFSPVSYHNGSVWPHDTMLAALGMAQNGLEEEALRLAAGLAAAGHHLDDRLPEYFAGFDTATVPFPVAMPLAGLPQAWAAAAGVAAVDLLRR